MKVKIYAKTERDAQEFAAKMNLALRHWEWTGTDLYLGIEWSNVGDVLDHYMFGGLPE